MNNAQTVLEFDKIKEMLSACALTLAAKEKINALSPYLDERKLRLQMEQTTGARRILDALGSPPISPMEDMQKLFTLCEAGAMLTCDQLLAVAQFDTGVRRMASYLKRAQNVDAAVASYGLSLCPQDELSGQIETAIRGEQVLDAASPALRSIRRKMDAVNAQVKAKLESLLKSKKQCFADSYVSSRGGRFVLPVKKEFKNQIPGQVVDVSKSGGTCFIEPAAAAKLSCELAGFCWRRTTRCARCSTPFPPWWRTAFWPCGKTFW